MTVFTIGFTKKSAADFFGLLRASGAERVVDVRLQNWSQLAGFAKRSDLTYFLREICGMDYVHLPKLLAPTRPMLDGYRKQHRDWPRYAEEFLALIRERRVEDRVSRELMRNGCLLCSEHEPDFCHRRLVVDYLQEHWGPMNVTHLG